MSNKKRKPADDRLFFKSYHETREAPAWKQLPPGARELFYELKKEYHRIQQGPVYLSARLAAERLGCDKASVVRWYAELEHYGFIVKVRAAQIGEKGLAAHYRLTDEIYLGEPPSKEFSFWNGTRYVRKKRTGCTQNAYIPYVRKKRQKAYIPENGKPNKTG
jgi:hypothetical protein